MPANFVIDQAASFKATILLSVEPRLSYDAQTKTQGPQERDRDNVPKWSVQVVVQYDQFGRTAADVITVTVASEKDPSEGVALVQPIRFTNLSVGVMDKKSKDGVLGGAQTFFRADSFAPITATASNGNGNGARSAAAIREAAS